MQATPGSAQLPAARSRWGLAIGMGILAEVATIVLIVIAVILTTGVTDPSAGAQSAAGQRIGMILGPVGGVLFTFGAAWWVASRRPSRPVMHGIVVALAAAALHMLGAFGSDAPITALAVGADFAKVAAGALAARLATHGSESDLEPLG